MPRDFKVFVTTNGVTYASFFQDGPRIFRVSGMKSIEAAWREYWEQWGQNEEGLDAIKPLRMDVLFRAIGRSPWSDYDALYFAGAVDDIVEVDGELRVILHARRPEPKHTFALRQDRWELVSSSGEEVSDAQIERERRKALSERFEAETKKSYSQTNDTSGVQTNK
jgi:hypothetical protein